MWLRGNSFQSKWMKGEMGSGVYKWRIRKALEAGLGTHTRTRAHTHTHTHLLTFHGSQRIVANEGLVYCCADSHHSAPENVDKPKTIINTHEPHMLAEGHLLCVIQVATFLTF